MSKPRLFVSYATDDSGDYAEYIYEIYKRSGHDVFMSGETISPGEYYEPKILDSISTCDIFIAIVTHSAMKSSHVEKEVLQAQRENKVIVPCMHKYVMRNQIKWNLTNLQGLEFKTEYDLAREMTRNLSLLYEKTRQKTTRKASNFGRQKQVTAETVKSKWAETDMSHSLWENSAPNTLLKPLPEKFCPSCKFSWEENGLVSKSEKCPLCRSKGIRFKLPGDDELSKLVTLREQGVITEEEFSQMKNNLKKSNS